MSGARKRSVPSWDKKEDAVPQTEMSGKIDSSFSPKRSNSEANDVLMSDDFSNENLPHRGGNRGTGYTSKDRDRDRSRSPHRSRGSHRDRERSPFNDERRELYENDSRASHRVCKDFPAGNCRRGGQCRFLHQDSGRPEYSSGSRFQDERNSADRPRSKNSDGHRKDPSRDEDSRDYHRGGGGGNRNADNDQDYRRQSNQTTKPACRFFLAGNCNRQRCKFSHDVPMSGEDHVVKSSRNVEEKNKSWNGPTWNDLETGGFDDKNQIWDEIGWNQESQPQNTGSTQFPTTLNGTEKSFEMNGGPKLLETSRNDTPSETLASKEEVPQVTSVPVSMPEKQILANALELLYSLPNSAPSGAPAVPPLEDVKREKLEDKLAENNPKREVENSGKSEKVEEGDEKAMRQFKIVLVEFVKEIMKPTWKEGKMSREVYKTIVKKVVDKVTSSIQGVQIPRTQEKIDQYLAFSKSKITKLVEAYVGRFLKA